jgi:hypothetical protein
LLAVRQHLPDVLKLRPISDHGNVNEIIGKFGGFPGKNERPPGSPSSPSPNG